jgi:hypothetical protein
MFFLLDSSQRFYKLQFLKIRLDLKNSPGLLSFGFF